MKENSGLHTNRLILESSPYLLQHAHNPVDWFAWSDEALQKAREEDKPVLISIGYSACHWCHVMERESFEDEKVAAFMNEHFVCIKVDREERPDLDQIYMEALQMLSGQGGWPLNMFLTPEGKPFYGGTYFPPQPAHGRPSWGQILYSVANSFKNNRAAINEQAEKVTDYISQSGKSYLTENVIKVDQDAENIFQGVIQNHFQNCRKYFDTVDGGFGSAPKFPHFHNVIFLLRYSFYTKNEEALNHALLSIDKMIQGGIYDQIGGGISRYSTDSMWLAPHFEKMLYDNALLIETLAEAYQITKNEIYTEKIHQIVAFIQREMLSAEGGFYAALDADSEGEEGKYYVWEQAEIEAILGDDAKWFCELFDIREHGNWEHKNILNQKYSLKEFSEHRNIDVALLKEKIKDCNEKLLNKRSSRIRPGLDDKIILGWNAMTNKALVKTYCATGNNSYKNIAVKNIEFLLEKFISSDNNGLNIYHTYKNGKATQPAFLDDLALLIDVLIEVYQISFDKRYLVLARQISDFTIKEFFSEENNVFYYSSAQQKDVILRKIELFDSVMPNGNSVMAHNLYRLAIIFDHNEYRKISDTMISQISQSAEKYPLSFGNWALMLLHQIYPVKEIAIVGNEFQQFADAIRQQYLPSAILMASLKADNEFPMLSNKVSDDKTGIYLCENNTCYAAVNSVDEFIKMLKN
jgi:uncharacterized protein YyaL (SSP411 family)